MNVGNVREPFNGFHPWLNTRESIQVRNPINLQNMGRSLIVAITSPSMREFTLGKPLRNVRTKGRPLYTDQAFLNVREFILERKPVSVRNVRRSLVIATSLDSMRKFTRQNGVKECGKVYNNISYPREHPKTHKH